MYQLNAEGDILEIAAWAKSSDVARAAFNRLCERHPDRSFEMRRRAWVEDTRVVVKG